MYLKGSTKEIKYLRWNNSKNYIVQNLWYITNIEKLERQNKNGAKHFDQKVWTIVIGQNQKQQKRRMKMKENSVKYRTKK